MTRQLLIIAITSFVLAQIAIGATSIYLHRALAHRSLSLHPGVGFLFRVVLWLLTGQRRHTNSCYVTYVAVDEHGRPTPVPPVLPETEDEKRRYRAAEKRRQRRQEHKAES